MRKSSLIPQVPHPSPEPDSDVRPPRHFGGLLDRFDRWGRSLLDLIATLQELASLDVGFVSLSEALDLTTPSGRALAGMLAVFAEFERDIIRDRVKAGIAQARKEGRPHGRPPTVAKYTLRVRALAKNGLSKSEISRRRKITRTCPVP